eukprot:scaffold10053_cov80-Skeletonema_marinoi.AAC.1
MLAVSIRGQGKGSSKPNIHVSQSSEKGEAVRQKALSPFLSACSTSNPHKKKWSSLAGSMSVAGGGGWRADCQEKQN